MLTFKNEKKSIRTIEFWPNLLNFHTLIAEWSSALVMPQHRSGLGLKPGRITKVLYF